MCLNASANSISLLHIFHITLKGHCHFAGNFWVFCNFTMSRSLNHFIALHGVIFTSKWLFSLFFSKNYNQTDSGNTLVLFACYSAWQRLKCLDWPDFEAVLYVIIYKLHLRNIEIKTINFVSYSTNILILKYFISVTSRGDFLHYFLWNLW